MTTPLSPQASEIEARFGRLVAKRLSQGNDQLPHEFSERLRAARTQAVTRRKVVQMRTAPVVVSRGGTATLGGGWWTRIGSVVPIVALMAGLVAISVFQDDSRTSELAEVDAALLTGDLPPAAYTDPGFAQFLKSDDTVVH